MLPGAEGLINSSAFKNSFGMIMDNEGLRVIDRACDFKVLCSQTEARGQKSEIRGQRAEVRWRSVHFPHRVLLITADL
jgi:hypothetical protein